MIMYPKHATRRLRRLFLPMNIWLQFRLARADHMPATAHSEPADLPLLVLSATPICVPERSSRKIKSGLPSPFTSESAKVNRGYLRASLGLRNSAGAAQAPSP